MVLFQFRTWPRGRNLLALAIYNLHGWHTLVLFPLERKSIAIRLPVRVRVCQ
jgi:hypothetical protein